MKIYVAAIGARRKLRKRTRSGEKMRKTQGGESANDGENRENNGERSNSKRRRASFFSWFGSSAGSLALHALLFLTLFWAIRGGTQTDGARGVRQTDEIGIVFSDSKEVDAGGGGANPEPETVENSNETPSSFEETSADDSSELRRVARAALPTPSVVGVAQNSNSAQNSTGFDAPATSGSGVGNRTGAGRGDGQNVGFGDVRGTGRKFVYVLDRSESMSWRGGAPMKQAIAETVASVESLDPKRGASKFQLVCFNHDVEVFEAGRGLVDVDLANKARVVRFLKSVTPVGGTAPEKALEIALRMRPDVVFFLTDADEELSETTLAEIRSLRRQYKVKQICVVEFGKANDPKKKTFRRLAGENDGAYVFKDVDSF